MDTEKIVHEARKLSLFSMKSQELYLDNVVLVSKYHAIKYIGT